MAETPARSTVDSRRDQMFPILTETEIARRQHFGDSRRFRDGELLFATGQRGVGMFVIISGRVAVLRHDGLGHVAPIRGQRPDGFIAELAHLSGRPALVDARAIGDVEALEIPPNNLRALMIAEADARSDCGASALPAGRSLCCRSARRPPFRSGARYSMSPRCAIPVHRRGAGDPMAQGLRCRTRRQRVREDRWGCRRAL